MGASGDAMTDACEDLAVKEAAKLVEGAGLLRPCSGNAAARREEGGSTRLRIRDFSKCHRNAVMPNSRLSPNGATQATSPGGDGAAPAATRRLIKGAVTVIPL